MKSTIGFSLVLCMMVPGLAWGAPALETPTQETYDFWELKEAACAKGHDRGSKFVVARIGQADGAYTFSDVVDLARTVGSHGHERQAIINAGVKALGKMTFTIGELKNAGGVMGHRLGPPWVTARFHRVAPEMTFLDVVEAAGRVGSHDHERKAIIDAGVQELGKKTFTVGELEKAGGCLGHRAGTQWVTARLDAVEGAMEFRDVVEIASRVGSHAHERESIINKGAEVLEQKTFTVNEFKRAGSCLGHSYGSAWVTTRLDRVEGKMSFLEVVDIARQVGSSPRERAAIIDKGVAVLGKESFTLTELRKAGSILGHLLGTIFVTKRVGRLEGSVTRGGLVSLANWVGTFPGEREAIIAAYDRSSRPESVSFSDLEKPAEPRPVQEAAVSWRALAWNDVNREYVRCLVENDAAALSYQAALDALSNKQLDSLSALETFLKERGLPRAEVARVLRRESRPGKKHLEEKVTKVARKR